MTGANAKLLAKMAWFTHGRPKARRLQLGSTEAEVKAAEPRWYPYLRGTRITGTPDIPEDGFETEEGARAASRRFLHRCVDFVVKSS
jgi:hypothetical protein